MRGLAIGCLPLAVVVSPLRAGTASINSFSSDYTATIMFDDGSGPNSGEYNIAQMNVTYNGGPGQVITFYTLNNSWLKASGSGSGRGQSLLAVPEPSSVHLVAMAAGCIGVWRLRRLRRRPAIGICR